MEPPPPATQPPLSAATNLNYADSLDSSPRSRNADWDEPLFPSTTTKLRLMCSYGGHIVPRPHDKSLCYVGGDTRIVVVDRHSSLSDLTLRLSKTLLNTTTNKPSFSLKYQLPNEELDSLISITTDEDLDNMIEEYDRLIAAAKPSRLRVFLFQAKPESGASIGSLLENSTKSEDWFLDALNGSNRGFSESSSVNCLLGLDDENDVVGVVSGNGNNSPVKESKGLNSNNSKVGGQDVHSVPDSPMLETTSSFGSTSSSPSQANLPPIRVHVEDQKPAMVVSGGIEEQLGQMSLSNKQEDGGFMAAPAPAMATGLATGFGLPGEYPNRVFSDDERSDQGVSVGFRKPQPQAPQSQPKPIDLASPDSVSSDSSVINPLSRQRAMIYQDPVVQNSSGGNNRVNLSPVDPKLSDQSSRTQMQQVQDYGYVLSNQYDHQQHQQLNQQIQLQQQQQQQHQQQQHQQQQQQQQQQFLQQGTHYMPVTSYYPVYPPQQQPLHPHHPIDQQYPMYYLSSRQAQAYNLPIQQQNYGEAPTSVSSSRPQTPPPSAMMAPPAAYATARSVPKPEMPTTMYRTGNTAAPQLVQVPSSQHQPQYTGFSQIQHPSQSVAPTSAATGNYAYEFADPAHAQMFYSQHMTPQLAAQYQTMTSAPAMARTEASAPLPSDNITQQIRTLQP